MRGGRGKADPADWFDAAEIARARAQSRAVDRRSILVSSVILVGVVLSLVARLATRVLDRTGPLPWAIEVIVVAAALAMLLEVLSLPFDVVYHRNDRLANGETKALWKQLTGDVVFALIALPAVLLGLMTLIRVTALWWLPMAFVAALFAIFARIVPLAWKHERLRDEALEDRLRRLARDAGVRTLDIYVAPRSNGSLAAALDAVLIGVGRTARIVLWNDVLERPSKEIDVHLARKLSSWRRRTIRRKVISTAIISPLSFLPSALVIGSHRVQHWVGASGRSDPRVMPLLILVLIPSLSAAGLVLNWQSRRHTRESDADTLNFTRDPDSFERVIRDTYSRLQFDLAPSFIQILRSGFPPPAERLALAQRWREARRVAVLFTDVEDATPLVERLGDDAWYDVLQDHNEILRRHVAVHQGREPASAGDGFLFVFDDVGEALICAIEIQRDLHRYATERSIDIRVRMGVHTGEVIRKGDAVIGREVHVAARIASAASGGQILVSDAVHASLSRTGRFRFGTERELSLKGLSGSYRTFDVDWRETDPLTVGSGRSLAR